MDHQQEREMPVSVLVVDDDQLIASLAEKILKERGVKQVDCFNNGEDAWEALNNNNYDLICLDWKLPGVSGLALFNRLRTHPTYSSTPIIVISGFLQKDDFKILSEYSCSVLLEKPFAKPQFDYQFDKVLDLKIWRDEAVTSMRDTMTEFDQDPRKGMKLLQEVIENSPDPMMQVVNAARSMRSRGLFSDAEQILRQALEKDPQAVTALTELGKVLHLMNRHKDASRALQAANFISSDNMERLLLMGEVKLHDLDHESARRHFEDALEIDPASQRGKAGLLSAQNMEEHGSSEGSLQNVPKSFASLLNIIAISKVRSGQLAEGVAQYKAALNFLHDDDTTARVYFNLGLAYLRSKKMDVARDWFAKSSQAGGSAFDKAAHYVRKLDENALIQGGVVPQSSGSSVESGAQLEPLERIDDILPPADEENVQFMEETDIVGGDLKITESADFDEGGDELEDAVAYI